MTTAVYTPAEFTGDAVTTVFPYTFRMPTGYDVVSLLDVDDNQGYLVRDVDYTITGLDNEGGGTVLYPIDGSSALASTYRILIERFPPLTQSLDLNNQTSWNPENLEIALDKLMMAIQNLSYNLTRPVAAERSFPLTGYIPHGRARTMPDRLAEDGSVDIKEFAALGADCGEYNFRTGVGTNDTDAIQNAFDFAHLEGIRAVWFPRTKYGQGFRVSAPITFTNDQWEIYGAGRAGTVIVATHDGIVFAPDTTSVAEHAVTGGMLYGVIRDLWFYGGGATFASTVAIQPTVNAAKYGMDHWVFENLRFSRMLKGIRLPQGKKRAYLGEDTVGTHSFNQFINLQVPLEEALTGIVGAEVAVNTLPTMVVEIPGASGAHNAFLGGNYRARPGGGGASIVIGDGDAHNAVGDTRIVGINFNKGPSAVKIFGPTTVGAGTGWYNSELTISNCQSDNMDTYSLDLTNMNDIKGRENNFVNQPHNLVNITNYRLRDQLHEISDRQSNTDYDLIGVPTNISKKFIASSIVNVGSAAASLSIAAGVLTPLKTRNLVNTEAAAATDDLDTVTVWAGATAGDLCILSPFSDARTVVIKNGTGNIHCGADITLDNLWDEVVLVLNEDLTSWRVRSFYSNGA
jgi:hypothetical protein